MKISKHARQLAKDLDLSEIDAYLMELKANLYSKALEQAKKQSHPKRPKLYGIDDLNKRLGKLTLGSFLHSWRHVEELTLKEFAKVIGLSATNLCYIEKGRKGVSPEKAEKIAKKIGVPPSLLVRLSIEEMLESTGLKYKVEIKPAA